MVEGPGTQTSNTFLLSLYPSPSDIIQFLGLYTVYMLVTPKFLFSSPTFPLNSRFLYPTAYMMFPSGYLILFLNQTLDPSPNLTSPSESPWLIKAKSCAIIVDSSLPLTPHSSKSSCPYPPISKDVSTISTSKTCSRSDHYWPLPRDHCYHVSLPCPCSRFMEGTYLSMFSFHDQNASLPSYLSVPLTAPQQGHVPLQCLLSRAQVDTPKSFRSVYLPPTSSPHPTSQAWWEPWPLWLSPVLFLDSSYSP